MGRSRQNACNSLQKNYWQVFSRMLEWEVQWQQNPNARNIIFKIALKWVDMGSTQERAVQFDEDEMGDQAGRHIRCPATPHCPAQANNCFTCRICSIISLFRHKWPFLRLFMFMAKNFTVAPGMGPKRASPPLIGDGIPKKLV